ncbi:hypothetical protein [Mucilaginibacter arboris]|uniref:Uncharacterized protein n=1 Tax=Mucilaginibacter arboris TaxID=2682090 RepID=A0A7K1SX08_9SPHI|nr:hypothetical protein [Mucilaginibacter arboris]MVN21590.1 hypothetical protein [Mucilaginibacter arboris]
MSIEDKNIPEQQKGNQVDVIHEETLKSREEAEKLFETVKKRLLNISHWGEIASGFSSGFQLTNSNGLEVDRPAQEGDCFKIHIPAPGPDSGNGDDWVKIEAIQDETDQAADVQVVSIRVRPSSNPQNPNQNVAHFFHEDATSTFIVKRKGNTVSAEVHSRNEVPNLKANRFWDTIRHTVVALGAILGFSNHQWKNLVEGLIEPKKDS